MRTEVTSALVSRIARAHGAQVVDHLLVGFKYIGDGIRALEEDGEFGGATGAASDFLVGVEESHGALVTPEIRDKDAAGAALLLAELASIEKDRGRSLVDCLEGLWARHGRVANVLVSTVMRGASGRQKIDAIQASLRADPPAQIGGKKVLSVRDHQDPSGIHGPIRSNTDLASRNVLSYALEDGARIIVRPSGTEPKTKVYAELFAQGDEDQEALTQACRDLAHSFVRDMLARIDIGLPPWTQHMSDLLSVEHRLDFSGSVLPQLEQRLSEGAEVEAWLDEAMASYGRDARRLVAGGIAERFKDGGVSSADLRKLFGLIEV
jgi:phosphomannomutase